MSLRTDLRNPLLFNLLERYYGQDRVDVVRPGEATDWYVAWDEDSNGRRTCRRKFRPGGNRGEEFRVACRACRDHTKRLYINHNWGVYDEETGTQNLWLANCYNEHCYQDYHSQQMLYEQIVLNALGRKQRRADIRTPDGAELQSRQSQQFRPPGVCLPLDKLLQNYPRHPAIQYLRKRQFDPVSLAKNWNISYCASADFPLAQDRLIIPIYSQGQIAAWQARHVGDTVNGLSFKEARVPKYFTMPGAPLQRLGYNFDRAVQHATVVIVEGVFDVWRVGPMALAGLGSSLSQYLRKQLVHELLSRHENPLVLVALDPQPLTPAERAKKLHPIDELVTSLGPMLQNRVVPVYLPSAGGADPASLPRKLVRDYCRQAAAKYGYTATFAAPASYSR